MIKLDKVSTAVLAAMIVSSCGGGGSPTPAPVATAAPTPAPTPTPTPTPTFSYTPYADLRGVQDFGTACIGHTPRANFVPSLDALLVFNEPGLVDQDIASANSWRWDITSIGSNSLARFRHTEDLGFDTFIQKGYDTTGSASFPNGYLSVFIPQRNDETDQAKYGRFGFAQIQAAAGEPVVTTACTWGVATDPEDVPSATVSYSGLSIFGRVYEAANGPFARISPIAAGTLDMQGDPATGRVTISLSYEVEDPDTLARTTVGPFTGEVSVDVSNDRTGYSGLLNIGGSPEYQINGAFYGPEGAETGFVATAQIDQDNDGLNERFIEIWGYGIR